MQISHERRPIVPKSHDDGLMLRLIDNAATVFNRQAKGRPDQPDYQ
jgi:hypothetical protein